MVSTSTKDTVEHGEFDIDLGDGLRFRLGTLMRAKGITQQQMADEFGVHINNFNKMVKGKTEGISWARLAGLCRLLECTVGDLIVYTPPTGPSPAP